MLTIYHISDFHFKADYPCIDRLKRLVEDIETQLPRNDAYLIFSGDLSFSGEMSQYESLLEHFFIPLEGRFKKMYMVPGNHDISRKKTARDQVNKLFDDKTQAYLFQGTSPIWTCRGIVPLL